MSNGSIGYFIGSKSVDDYVTVIMPYHAPGIACPDCSSWAGNRRFPFEVPASIADELVRFGARGCISCEEFASKADGWEESLGFRIEPGDGFPPSSWLIERLPDYDIEWGLFHILFSQQLVDKLTEHGVTGFLPHPVSILPANRKIWDVCGCVSYYDILFENDTSPTWEANHPEGVSTCDLCRRTRFDEPIPAKIERSRLTKSRILPAKYCFDVDLFGTRLLFNTPGFVASERAFEVLSQFDLSNAIVEEVKLNLDDSIASKRRLR